MVKGKPLRVDKSKIQEGQQLQLKESVWFSSLQDVVILMNDKFEKIYAKPKDNMDLAKKVPLKFYLVKGTGEERKVRGGEMGLRGMEKIRQWQSVDDSLRLNLVKDLGLKSQKSGNKFILFDRFMEEFPHAIRLNGQDIVVKPSKLGLYYVFMEEGGKSGKQLAEVEFFEKNEVKSELRFIAQNAVPKDSAEVIQLKYIKGMYPFLPDYQLETIVLRAGKK
jgi:hypothetical protein